MVLSLTFAVLLQQERSTVLVGDAQRRVSPGCVYGAMHDAGEHLAGRRPRRSRRGWWGCSGSCCSRYRFASALPYVTAAIGPLLPGSATYFGLLAIAQNDAGRGAGAR